MSFTPGLKPTFKLVYHGITLPGVPVFRGQLPRVPVWRSFRTTNRETARAFVTVAATDNTLAKKST